MKAEECQIGVQVFTEDGPAYLYEVTALPDDRGMVQVKPIKKSYGGSRDSIHIEDLYLYNEEQIKKVAAELQERIDKAKSAFEIAFEQLSEVRNYYNRETGISRYSLEEIGLLNLGELETTVDRGGWSSSSLWC